MTTNMPADLLTASATILVLLVYLWTGWNVGSMRSKHGIKAPAVSGHPEFERAYRVQLNTLEQLVVVLPLLWLATLYFHWLGWLPALFGLIWAIGRIIYKQAYMADPAKRSTGFMIGGVATLALLIMAIIGIVQSWIAVHAV